MIPYWREVGEYDDCLQYQYQCLFCYKYWTANTSPRSFNSGTWAYEGWHYCPYCGVYWEGERAPGQNKWCRFYDTVNLQQLARQASPKAYVPSGWTLIVRSRFRGKAKGMPNKWDPWSIGHYPHGVGVYYRSPQAALEAYRHAQRDVEDNDLDDYQFCLVRISRGSGGGLVDVKDVEEGAYIWPTSHRERVLTDLLSAKKRRGY